MVCFPGIRNADLFALLHKQDQRTATEWRAMGLRRSMAQFCIRQLYVWPWRSVVGSPKEPIACIRGWRLFTKFLHYIIFNQAYKHVFTSPSSVEREPKATRSGNARLHGMTSVTIASIAYIATQVRRVRRFCMQTILTSTEGPVCVKLVFGVLKDRHNHRFRDVLP